MNTHILFSIEQINDIEKRFTEHTPLEYIKNELLKVGKHLSLDENDVAEKANEFAYGKQFDYSTSTRDTIIGYKQAIKDLL